MRLHVTSCSVHSRSPVGVVFDAVDVVPDRGTGTLQTLIALTHVFNLEYQAWLSIADTYAGHQANTFRPIYPADRGMVVGA